MTTISIRLQDDIVEEVKIRAQELHIPRAEYIRRAIQSMNEKVGREIRTKRIKEASKRVREESMRVNAEFAAVERDLDV